jgi:hypothetical protein
MELGMYPAKTPEEIPIPAYGRSQGTSQGNISPLAFLDYDEETALHRISAVARERPQDTDPNSTNCLLNSFANLVHVEQLGYHPYATELASLVRGEYMDRQEALKRLGTAPVPKIVAAVEAKLGIPVPNKQE